MWGIELLFSLGGIFFLDLRLSRYVDVPSLPLVPSETERRTVSESNAPEERSIVTPQPKGGTPRQALDLLPEPLSSEGLLPSRWVLLRLLLCTGRLPAFISFIDAFGSTRKV